MVDPKELERYTGKQVILHLIEEDGSVSEHEGRIEAASEFGIAFKEKGKRDSALVEVGQIEEVTAAAVKPKTLAQKKLKEINEGTVRQHLLDRHGYERSVVNGMTDEQGWAEHGDIDHSDLGHRHISEDDEDENENGDSED